MDHFQYRVGHLMAESVPIARLAEEVGTPFYVYSQATLERHFGVFSDGFSSRDTLVCYAVKANSNIAVLKVLAAQGAGADVVSRGELTRALAANIAPERIVFSGVGKSAEDMVAALDAGILQINVESEPELETLSGVAEHMGKTANVAIRLNPDVDALTHEKISTGKRENKFGIAIERAGEVYARAADLPSIRVTGATVHIGSQITSLDPFRAAYERFLSAVLDLRGAGHDIANLDLGGGLGIPYGENGGNMDGAIPTPADYAAMILDVFKDVPGRLVLEPGRVIAGNAGILVSRVLYVKEGEGKRFVIVDAAMNDLVRPTLYDAHHTVLLESEPAESAPVSSVDVVGPICESGDTFARDRALAPVAAGDLLVFRSAGAYGAVQASMYNARALVPEVLVNGEEFAIVRRRFDVSDQIALEETPGWLGD